MKLPILLLLLTFPSLNAQSGFTSQQSGMTGTIRGLNVVSKKVIWVSGTKGEFSVTHNGGYTKTE